MYADASDRSWTPKSNLNSVIIKRNLLYVATCVVNPFYSRASVHHWPMYRSSHGHIFWWIYSSDVWQFRRQPSPVTHRNLRVCRCLLFLWHNKVEFISNLSYRLQHKLFWDKNEDIREQTMLSYLYSPFVDRFSDDIEYGYSTKHLLENLLDACHPSCHVGYPDRQHRSHVARKGFLLCLEQGNGKQTIGSLILSHPDLMVTLLSVCHTVLTEDVSS